MEVEESVAEAGFEFQQRVASALHALPEPYKTTIYRRYYQDLGPSEIAARDRVPLDTVKTRLRRGLAILRTDLDRRYGERGWSAPLASFLGWRPGAEIQAAPVAGLLNGVLTMKAISITLASLAAAVAAVAAIRLSQPGEDPLAPDDARGAAAPGAVLAGDVEAAPPLRSDEREPSRVAVETPAARGASTEPAQTRLGRVRVVDVGGAPLGGVRVRFARGGPAAAETSSEGRAALEPSGATPPFPPDATRQLEPCF